MSPFNCATGKQIPPAAIGRTRCSIATLPYWNTEGCGVDFGAEQYELLAAEIGTLQGKAIVSVNDIPEMRKVFGNFRCQRVGIRYTVGGAGRAARTGELIIRSWSSA